MDFSVNNQFLCMGLLQKGEKPFLSDKKIRDEKSYQVVKRK